MTLPVPWGVTSISALPAVVAKTILPLTLLILLTSLVWKISKSDPVPISALTPSLYLLSPVNVLPVTAAKLPLAVTPPCHAEPLYTLSSLAVVLKNKSPVSRPLVGLLAPTRYLSEKSFTSPILVATVLTFAIAPPTLFILLTLVAQVSKSDTILPQPTDPEMQMNVLFEIIQ